MPEAQEPPPPLPKSQPSFGKRYSTIIKLLGVGALVLVLLIPLAMITGVLSERLQRRNEAVGSEGIFFAPFGVQNETTLKSTWADPGFRGAFLPAERSVRPDGFDAKWKVSYYGRDYPQSWTSRTGNERFTTQAVSNSLFGAQFLSILDAYRYVERSIKYGVLFLVLVFTAFFLFEVTARQKIHPFQYLMVGAALCLFYLLLLSISEFIGFSCGGRIDDVNHVVLPFLPRGRCAHVNDRRRACGRLHISLHHFATARLRTANGRDCALYRAGDRHVRDAQGRLVRSRCELEHRWSGESMQLTVSTRFRITPLSGFSFIA
jgi:hypothetical protein